MKLARAARLSAEASRLYAEAAQELEDGWTPPDETGPVTQIDQARARRALARVGARTR